MSSHGSNRSVARTPSTPSSIGSKKSGKSVEGKGRWWSRKISNPSKPTSSSRDGGKKRRMTVTGTGRDDRGYDFASPSPPPMPQTTFGDFWMIKLPPGHQLRPRQRTISNFVNETRTASASKEVDTPPATPGYLSYLYSYLASPSPTSVAFPLSCSTSPPPHRPSHLSLLLSEGLQDALSPDEVEPPVLPPSYYATPPLRPRRLSSRTLTLQIPQGETLKTQQTISGLDVLLASPAEDTPSPGRSSNCSACLSEAGTLVDVDAAMIIVADHKQQLQSPAIPSLRWIGPNDEEMSPSLICAAPTLNLIPPTPNDSLKLGRTVSPSPVSPMTPRADLHADVWRTLQVLRSVYTDDDLDPSSFFSSGDGDEECVFGEQKDATDDVIISLRRLY